MQDHSNRADEAQQIAQRDAQIDEQIERLGQAWGWESAVSNPTYFVEMLTLCFTVPEDTRARLIVKSEIVKALHRADARLRAAR